MEDEEVTEAPNHFLYTEDEDGTARMSCRATGGCLLVIMGMIAVIVLLIVLRRTGVI